MTAAHALRTIRETSKQLPASVGTYHRTCLVEAAYALEASHADLLAALRNLVASLEEQDYRLLALTDARIAIARVEGRTE